MFDLPVGWIYLDSLFSPVTRVNYSVTNARVGKRTDYDRLTLEVWTNAGIDPVDAVAYSAKILRDQLNVFLNFEDEDAPVEVKLKFLLKQLLQQMMLFLSQYLNLSFQFVLLTVFRMQILSTFTN